MIFVKEQNKQINNNMQLTWTNSGQNPSAKPQTVNLKTTRGGVINPPTIQKQCCKPINKDIKIGSFSSVQINDDVVCFDFVSFIGLNGYCKSRNKKISNNSMKKVRFLLLLWNIDTYQNNIPIVYHRDDIEDDDEDYIEYDANTDTDTTYIPLE